MTDVMVTNDKYPCCGHQARVPRKDHNNPRLIRHCTRCGAGWEVLRARGRTVNGVRFDELSWRRINS